MRPILLSLSIVLCALTGCASTAQGRKFDDQQLFVVFMGDVVVEYNDTK